MVAGLLAGCGRFGVTDVTATVDAPAVNAAGPRPIHQYSLANSFADDFGGPPITGLGGSFVAGGYQFTANDGLTLTDAMPAAVYTVDIEFELDAVDGYRKVIDFKNRVSDAGLYVFDGQLQFVVVPVTGCPGDDCFTSPVLFANAAQAEITLTRDAAGTVGGYVNKAPQFTFADSTNVGTFDATGTLTNFFVDDNVTTGSEAAAGTVRRIQIYDVALTSAEIAASD